MEIYCRGKLLVIPERAELELSSTGRRTPPQKFQLQARQGTETVHFGKPVDSHRHAASE